MAAFPPNMSYKEAVAMAHALVYEPRRVARAVHLASNPCPIDELEEMIAEARNRV